MKTLILSLALLLLLPRVAEALTCTRTTSSAQSCTAIVTWPASVVDATHDAPTSYTVQRRDGTGSFVTQTTVASTQLSFNDTFTDGGNLDHCWQIIATNAGGSSAPAPMGCLKTPTIQVLPPNPPAVTQVAALSSSEIQVTLQDRSDNELGFQIEQRGGSFGTKMYELNANETVLLASGLQAHTRYGYRARAINDAGASAWSSRKWTRTLR